MTEKHSSKLIKNLLKNISKDDLEKTRVKMTLSARIADELSNKKMSQKDLADLMKKSPSEISKWLSGNHNFTTDTLVEICSVLKIDIDSLFKMENEIQTIQTVNLVLQLKVDPDVRNQSYPYYSKEEDSSKLKLRVDSFHQIYHWTN